MRQALSISLFNRSQLQLNQILFLFQFLELSFCLSSLILAHLNLSKETLKLIFQNSQAEPPSLLLVLEAGEISLVMVPSLTERG